MGCFVIEKKVGKSLVLVVEGCLELCGGWIGVRREWRLGGLSGGWAKGGWSWGGGCEGEEGIC